MYSSSKAPKNEIGSGEGHGGKKGKVARSAGNSSSWKVTGKKDSKKKRFYFDSYKVGTADGKIRELGKHFCTCEELNKLTQKAVRSKLTRKERVVLTDMARRYRVCLNFALEGGCKDFYCNYKHVWFNEQDAMKQAGIELKFTGQICKCCKARPHVFSEFTRRAAEREARWEAKRLARRNLNSDTSSTTGSTTSSVPLPRKPGGGLYNSNALVQSTGKAWTPESKKAKFTAEDFPSLKSMTTPVPPVKIPLEGLKFRKSVPQSKEDFEPLKKLDTPIKLSDLSGTDISKPIGLELNPSRMTTAPSTVASTPTVEYSEAPEYDPNDFTSEDSSSNTSMTKIGQEPDISKEMAETSMAHEIMNVPAMPVPAPATSTLPPNDTMDVMRGIHDMMQQMRVEMQNLKAENAALKTRLSM